MERGSDKHSPRVDDALAGETAGIVHGGHDSREEWRSAEPSGEDQPDVGLGGETAISGGTPEGMTAQDIADRSELAGWLGRASFPAVREMLLAHVMDEGAPETIVEQVRALPAGREFTNTGDVWRTLHKRDGGEHVETHRF
ncbi:MAG: hypothetical protein JWN96_2390 [Mycobacterium sp.]|jgi:hypothetical protein|nr:hypothetical protein [Mycobacterium sp.]